MLTGHVHDHYARGTAWSMLAHHAGRRWLYLAERMHAAAARRYLHGRPRVAWAIRQLGRLIAVWAAFHYWRGRHITYQRQGWLRIHRQNGGVALLYAANRWTRAIDDLIWSGQRTAYGPGTRAWEQANVGIPVMLAAAFRDGARGAREAHDRTLGHYRDEARYRRATLRTRRVWLICVARLASHGLADDVTIRDALGT